MEKKIELLRTGLCVTQKCTLKCKLCLAFIPYYKNPKHLTLEETKVVLRKYFELVDSVGIFTITGGEPLLNPEIYEIMELLYQYSEKITRSIDFVTNGTLEIPQKLLELFSLHSEHTKVVLSNYGKLSTRIGEISNELRKRKIVFRVSDFYSDNLYFDGWIDFRNHDKKIFNTEERDFQGGEKCLHGRGKYFLINEGELHKCSRSYWRIKNGIIPRVKGEFVDLLADAPVDEKKKDLRNLLNAKSVTSCGHCVGFRDDIEREYPAEQLKKGEK